MEKMRLDSVEWPGTIRAAARPIKAAFPLHYISKRIIDVIGAFSGLVLLAPLFLVITVIIKISDPKGSVLFQQQRIGHQYQMFGMLKFRSMVHNAEKILKDNKPLFAKYVANNYKLEGDEDPRITRIGKFIRRTSLDELPQLINVLRGEMSLVGPRPIIYEELEEYGEQSFDFLSVKPGVTGYWQIKGRSNVGYPERKDLELHYVYNQSLRLDFYILFKTILLVLFQKGAY